MIFKFLIKLLLIATLFGLIIFFTKNKEKEEIKFQQKNNNISTSTSLCENCNIILISVDSLRADHMSAYGYKRKTTPNFDKFSEKSFLFMNYYTTSFLTPVSEMSVHTGLYPSVSHVTNFDTPLSENIPTLTEYLKSKGYRTDAIFSSPEFSELNEALEMSFSRGFDTYKSVDPVNNNRRPYPTMDTITPLLNKSENGKFFLWLALGGVHWPYGKVDEKIYTDKNYAGQLRDKELDWWFVFKNIYNKIVYPEKTELTNEDINYVRDNYDDGVHAFDTFLGNLIKQLEQNELLENTMVIIESEHGEDLGEHGYFAHYDVMDTQIHTPLLIYIPSKKNGVKINSFASPIDIFPTIIETLGYTETITTNGESIVPILTNKESDGLRQEVFSERSPLWEEAHKYIRKGLENQGIQVVSGKYKDIAIRTNEWKYILRLSKERVEKISWWAKTSGQKITIDEAELYNLKDDPGELNNVISKYPSEAKYFKSRVETWLSENTTTTEKYIGTSFKVQPYF